MKINNFPEYRAYYNSQAYELAKWSLKELHDGNRYKANKIKKSADRMEWLYREYHEFYNDKIGINPIPISSPPPSLRQKPK